MIIMDGKAAGLFTQIQYINEGIRLSAETERAAEETFEQEKRAEIRMNQDSGTHHDVGHTLPLAGHMA